MELGCKWDSEIKDRCRRENIDIDNCYVMFNRGGDVFFCGEPISSYSESKDERWVCVPVEDEEMEIIFGEYIYKPKCFEVRHRLTTYLSNGYISILTDVWILEK